MPEIGYLTTFFCLVFIGAVVWRFSNFVIDRWLSLLHSFTQYFLKKLIILIDKVLPWFLREK